MLALGRLHRHARSENGDGAKIAATQPAGCLAGDSAKAESEAQQAEQAMQAASTALSEKQAEDRQARQALNAAFAALNDARATYGKQETESSASSRN